MNHFQLFDIPQTFTPDQQLLKQKFYELSRKYHPDFYAQSSGDEQADILEKASQVNKAYKILQNPDATIKYLLQLKDLLEEEEKYQLPPDFLMDVMDLNEQLMDAKMEDDEAKLTTTRSAIVELQKTIYEPVKNIVEGYSENTTTNEELLQVKQYYYQKKYLDRILAAI